MKQLKSIWMKNFRKGQDYWEVTYWDPWKQQYSLLELLDHFVYTQVELIEKINEYGGELVYTGIPKSPMMIFDSSEKAKLFIDEVLEPRLMMYLLSHREVESLW